MLGPRLFILFISDLDVGIVGTLRKSTDDTKLGAVSDAPEGLAAIQRDLDRLEKGTNLMLLNKGKCHVLGIGWETAPQRRTWGS
ncbi:rna-directed dna polymerase from mobile element jockey-like [Willisornis vidua]|uniref:Rna-directed dna polymerase from mobile element jockey-like n=1 Tax=Willisornis vidua TaxID=1566151 RepID=A0ABQ9D2V7_9PASS|nr:rna-directed dna polymerase from mobile element jockey-like [Willisornis vidua]